MLAGTQSALRVLAMMAQLGSYMYGLLAFVATSRGALGDATEKAAADSFFVWCVIPLAGGPAKVRNESMRCFTDHLSVAPRQAHHGRARRSVVHNGQRCIEVLLRDHGQVSGHWTTLQHDSGGAHSSR